MPIESELKKPKTSRITEEMLGAEVRDDVARENSQDLKDDAKFEITPELIEKVMTKVKDVNGDGTAFTGLALKCSRFGSKGEGYININGQEVEASEENIEKLNSEALLSALTYGLLGRKFFGRAEELKNEQSKQNINLKDRWIEEAKRERSAVLFANIVGKDIKRLNRAYYLLAPTSGNYYGRFGIIYNLEGYDETLPYSFFRERGSEKDFRKRDLEVISLFKYNTFRDNSGSARYDYYPLHEPTRKIVKLLGLSSINLTCDDFIKKIKEKKKDLILRIPKINNYIEAVEKAGSFGAIVGPNVGDDGFIVGRRIASRKFDGICINTRRDYRRDKDWRTELKLRKEENEKMLSEAIRIMVAVSNDSGQNRFFPIYDEDGNLLWPKKMGYEEVKKFVAERDKKKEI